MASYEAWNQGIINYFLSGEPKGSHIFLSVDAEAITDMCDLGFIDEPISSEPLSDFCNAIINKCLDTRIDRFNLDIFKKNTPGSIPLGVGFLSAMVLAAYEMHDEGEIDESNYFVRFREFLKITCNEKGRPDGMSAGSEELLWKKWNNFLIKNGFLPTAKPGKGPRKYLEYVISQTILREADKRYLKNYYAEKGIQSMFDCEQLGFFLSRDRTIRRHLKEGLNYKERSRMWAFYQACQRVYMSEDWIHKNNDSSPYQAPQNRKIECGLLKSDSLFGDTEYLLFPKQPARFITKHEFYVIHGNEKKELENYRPGFYAPLWDIDPIVDNSIEYKLDGSSLIKTMVFPKRDFWILSCDPEENDSYATWKPFTDLGEKLLIICRKGKFSNEMKRFRDAGLIDWKDETIKDTYHEFQDVMIASYNWGGFICSQECKNLADAITPRSLATISLSGGLRDSNQNAWLEGYPPLIKIYGFQQEFEIIVKNASEEIIKKSLNNQEEFTLPYLKPDIYKIEAKSLGETVAVRMLRTIPWVQISFLDNIKKVENCHPSSTGEIKLRGPVIIH